MESSEVNLFQLETTAEVLNRKEFHTIKKKNHQVEQSLFVHKEWWFRERVRAQIIQVILRFGLGAMGETTSLKDDDNTIYCKITLAAMQEMKWRWAIVGAWR